RAARQPAPRAGRLVRHRRPAPPRAALQRALVEALQLDDADRGGEPDRAERLRPLPRGRRDAPRRGLARHVALRRAARRLRALPLLQPADARRPLPQRGRREGGGGETGEEGEEGGRGARPALERGALGREPPRRLRARRVDERDPGRRRRGHRQVARHVGRLHRDRLPRDRRRRGGERLRDRDGAQGQDGPLGRDRARELRPDRALRRAAARPREPLRGADAAGALVHARGDGVALPRRAARHAGDERRLVELVQGSAADRDVRDLRPALLLPPDVSERGMDEGKGPTRSAGAKGRAPAKQRVLDPIERSSEVLFGLIMVLSFTGSMSVAASGHAVVDAEKIAEEIHEMLVGALGCNLAWGIVDAIMYLLNTLGERGRGLKLARGVRDAKTPEEAREVIAEAMPDALARSMHADDFERI